MSWDVCTATGKRSFSTRSEAKTAASRAPRLRAYRCQACPGWHVGHIATAVLAGRKPHDQQLSDVRAGVDVHAVRVCPGCSGEGTIDLGILHARDCPSAGDDVAGFPRRPRLAAGQ